MTAEAIEVPAPAAPAVSVVSTTVTPATYVPLVLCRCGHEVDSHEYHRRGDDCGVCGPIRCRSFRRRTGRAARSSLRR